MLSDSKFHIEKSRQPQKREEMRVPPCCRNSCLLFGGRNRLADGPRGKEEVVPGRWASGVVSVTFQIIDLKTGIIQLRGGGGAETRG